jgi:hypothetical protein
MKTVKLTPDAVNALRRMSYRLSAERNGPRVTLSQTVLILCGTARTASPDNDRSTSATPGTVPHDSGEEILR